MQGRETVQGQGMGKATLEEEPKRSEGERSSPERSVVSSSNAARVSEGGEEAPAAAPPNPEVSAKATRRRFTAEYKQRILSEVDGCTQAGQLGALLRREGLYSSHLIVWRRQRHQGILAALKPNPRGRKKQPPNPLAPRVAELERENRQLQRRLKKAETIIEFQKKVSELLGIPLKNLNNDDND